MGIKISIITVGMNHKKYLEALYGFPQGSKRLCVAFPEAHPLARYVDRTDGGAAWQNEIYQ